MIRSAARAYVLQLSDPLSLILCFRVGLNILGDPNPANSDLLVQFTASSLFVQVRCRIWRFHPYISPLFAFKFSLWVDMIKFQDPQFDGPDYVGGRGTDLLSPS